MAPINCLISSRPTTAIGLSSSLLLSVLPTVSRIVAPAAIPVAVESVPAPIIPMAMRSPASPLGCVPRSGRA